MVIKYFTTLCCFELEKKYQSLTSQGIGWLLITAKILSAANCAFSIVASIVFLPAICGKSTTKQGEHYKIIIIVVQTLLFMDIYIYTYTHSFKVY